MQLRNASELIDRQTPSLRTVMVASFGWEEQEALFAMLHRMVRSPKGKHAVGSALVPPSLPPYLDLSKGKRVALGCRLDNPPPFPNRVPSWGKEKVSSGRVGKGREGDGMKVPPLPHYFRASKPLRLRPTGIAAPFAFYSIGFGVR